jgi:TorA maturation chaperone TorD
MESATLAACELRAQADLYSFMARVLGSHPDEESMRALSEIAAEMEIACPSGFSLSELEREYMELFVVPGPKYVAPYESVFRDRWLLPEVLKRGSNPGETGQTIKGLLMGESTLAVRETYLQAGLLPEQDLPDHVSNELRFLAYLCAIEADAPAAEAPTLAQTRERFRQEHVAKWIGELREKVGERDRLGYYRAAAEVTEALLSEDGDPEKPEVVPISRPMARASGCPFHHGEGVRPAT